ncbi:unnamed protein product [Effrenium voratum]|uniref:Uncharacterized protein n=1 Tax=Effrenium voratum TaxID=2562239 RepID=A0AA36N8H0_9DINO|nr:unnamed protein product [Effrenium voratum]
MYSHKDGGWVKEEKMSASLHDTNEADCYGFVLPSAEDAFFRSCKTRAENLLKPSRPRLGVSKAHATRVQDQRLRADQWQCAAPEPALPNVVSQPFFGKMHRAEATEVQRLMFSAY